MTDERRRYFRIFDDFRVCYRLAPADSAGEAPVTTDQDQHRLKLLISKISAVSVEVADALALIDQRLVALEGGMATDEDTAEGVNLSACGVAFVAKEDLRPGALVEVALYLDSASLVVNAIARVVGSDPAVAHLGCSVVRTDFVRINPDERELLIQYVLRRQGEQLRHRATG